MFPHIVSIHRKNFRLQYIQIKRIAFTLFVEAR